MVAFIILYNNKGWTIHWMDFSEEYQVLIYEELDSKT